MSHPLHPQMMAELARYRHRDDLARAEQKRLASAARPRARQALVRHRSRTTLPSRATLLRLMKVLSSPYRKAREGLTP